MVIKMKKCKICGEDEAKRDHTYCHECFNFMEEVEKEVDEIEFSFGVDEEWILDDEDMEDFIDDEEEEIF